MNRFHPIHHSAANPPGCRIDVERILPASPKDIDPEELLDNLSEPPHYLERLAPVRVQVGDELVRGKNWTDLMIKTYRAYGRMWSRLTTFVHPVLRDTFGELGMLPLQSICIDPDMLHRIIEADYDTGEDTYGNLIQLFRKGVLSPCATVPFGLMLPMLDSDFDRRAAIRIGFLFYGRLIEAHYEHIRKTLKESEFVVPFWLPECAYCERTLEILYEEFLRYRKETGRPKAHLALLLDSAQAESADRDMLVKSWNTADLGTGSNGDVSVVFHDKGFSDWVSFAIPSVKKLLDRIIAKVDSRLNAEDANYCWSHFEDLDALSFSPRSAINYEQKMLKLTELGYLPVSPDVYVRRKLNGKFRRAHHEPQPVRLFNGDAPFPENGAAFSFARWEGLRQRDGATASVVHPTPFVRFVRDGEVQEAGHQSWKIACNLMRRRVFDQVRGNPETLKGGIFGVLRGMLPGRSEALVRRNIENFLVDYAHIHWREHFIQHDLSEADISAMEIVKRSLFRGVGGKPSALRCAAAIAAAQAYYFALDGHRPCDTRQNNFDQRAVYQNSTMLTLAVCNMIYVYRWLKRAKDEAAMFRLLKEELIDFESAYARHKLSQYGVTQREWAESIASHVDDSRLNCVARAARSAAARHLRPLGYRREFTREDENITTHVGHIWAEEVHNPNYRWENHLFCGAVEE